MKIILVGYMGSGKSAVGKKLAEVMQIPFVDLDFFIEKNQKKSISEIFKDDGELQFRKLEHTFFVALLQNSDSFVLALGGGTPCYANNHLLLQQENVFSVYLKTNLETLVERLVFEKKNRPLISNLPDDEMTAFVGKHLFERSYFYNFSKFIVSTNQKTVLEICEEVKFLVK
jgi:shikimate kinase